MNIEFKGPIYPEQPYSPENEKETIVVGQDDNWKMTKTPNIIETSALGPCVGIVIYDPESQQAMVGHYPDPENSEFSDILEEAKKLFPNQGKLQIFVGGNEPLESHPTYHKQKAQYIKKQLAHNGFVEEQITSKWQQIHQATVMRMDTASGEMEYQIDDDDHLDGMLDEENI